MRNSRAVDGLKRSQSHHEKPYRFHSTRILELALYHSVGNLREPKHTHEFFGRGRILVRPTELACPLFSPGPRWRLGCPVHDFLCTGYGSGRSRGEASRVGPSAAGVTREMAAFHQSIREAPCLLPDKFCRLESDQVALRIRSKRGIRSWVLRSRVRHAHLPPNRKTEFLNQKHSILLAHSNRTGLARGGVSSAAVRSRSGTVVTSAHSARRIFDPARKCALAAVQKRTVDETGDGKALVGILSAQLLSGPIWARSPSA
jgi:hypothetical protein